MDDIHPMRKGAPTQRGEHVGEICVRISGSKTEWPNPGCVRSHTLVGPNSPNSDICVVSAFIFTLPRLSCEVQQTRRTPRRDTQEHGPHTG